MDKLEAIKIFVEVAKRNSFVNTSEHLGLSAPAVTRAIAALEKNLGVKLFNRTTRLVKLTEPGVRFLKDAKHILESLEEAEAAATGVYTQPKGTLTITAPVLFGQKHITPIITEYLALHPQVSVQAMFYDRITSLIEEELDVAIRIGHLKDSNLYAKQVGHVRRVVCGSPAYFEQYGEPLKPEDLNTHSLIFASTFDSTTAWQFTNKGQKQTLKFAPRLRCNQNATALNAAVQGFGITRLMSYQVGEELKKGNLQTVLSQYEEPPLPVNILYLEGRRANAKVRSFIDLAAERLAQNPFINPG